MLSPHRRVPVSPSALRQARRAAGLTQEALAHRAGITTNSVHRLEAGRHWGAQVATVQALADVLGVSPDYLIGSWRGDE